MLRQVVYSNFQFQGNNYANEPEMRGRFHHQRVSCRSDLKRQDVCQVSSKNPTTPLAFVPRNLLRDDALLLLLNNCFQLLN